MHSSRNAAIRCHYAGACFAEECRQPVGGGIAKTEQTAIARAASNPLWRTALGAGLLCRGRLH